MTTISNFIDSNFVDQSPDSSEKMENPIWILNSNSKERSVRQLRQYFIEKSILDNKPLIHVDLGINTLTNCRESPKKQILVENGLKLWKPIDNKMYFIINHSIKQRIQINYLSLLIKNIKFLKESEVIRQEFNQNNVTLRMKGSFGILVEGLETFSVLNKNNEENLHSMEQFISNLSNLPDFVKQITIFTCEDLLSKETMFLLQKISTCLTNITEYEHEIWHCLSTVRRYTGYSNEEIYQIHFNKAHNKIKVTKKKIENVGHIETAQQKQMVNSLGFIVKKNTNMKQQEKQLKKMIYPYLNKQNDCTKKDCQKECFCKEQDTEDLIILDDEQEDDDDIDV